MASSGTPAASAQAAAAERVLARCAGRRMRSANGASPAGVCSRTRPVAAPAMRRSARTSAGAVAARRSARGARRPAARHSGVKASSAGNTATPSRPSASITAPFSRADGLDAGHEFLVLALRVVDQRDRRRGDRAPAARSRPDGSCRARPRRRGAACSSWRRRSRVSGTPMWLFRLPAVAKAAVAEAGAQDRGDHLRHRGLAVAAGDGDQRQRRSARARRRPAAAAPTSVSATCRPGSPASARPRSAERRHGAGLRAPAAGSHAHRSARRVSATNRSPARRLRVSLCTRAKRTCAVADQQRAGQQRVGLRPASSSRAPPARRRRARRASSTSENARFSPAISW